jgi:hypothetical protein
MHNPIVEERCMVAAGDIDMELDSDRGLDTYLIDIEIVIVMRETSACPPLRIMNWSAIHMARPHRQKHGLTLPENTYDSSPDLVRVCETCYCWSCEGSKVTFLWQRYFTKQLGMAASQLVNLEGKVCLSKRYELDTSLETHQGKNVMVCDSVSDEPAVVFLIMNLPTEIRLRIYQHAFAESKVMVDTGGTLRARYKESNRHLLQANSKIRAEAIDIFAASTELTYYGSDLESVRHLTPTGFVTNVRRLKCLFFSPVGELLMKLPSLRELEIEFRHRGVVHDAPIGPGMEARCDELLAALVTSETALMQGWPKEMLENKYRKFTMLVAMEFSHQRYAEPFVRVCVDLDKEVVVSKEMLLGK